MNFRSVFCGSPVKAIFPVPITLPVIACEQLTFRFPEPDTKAETSLVSRSQAFTVPDPTILLLNTLVDPLTIILPEPNTHASVSVLETVSLILPGPSTVAFNFWLFTHDFEIILPQPFKEIRSRLPAASLILVLRLALAFMGCSFWVVIVNVPSLTSVVIISSMFASPSMTIVAGA